MHIRKVKIKNYRSLKDTVVEFNEHLNIIVGDNETGKSTLLEAINLALSGQLNGRSIYYELHPFLFNINTVDMYFKSLQDRGSVEPPEILIELYLANTDELASLKGTNNTLRQNCPGITLKINLDESFGEEYHEYIKNPSELRNVPIEYYDVEWLSFANNTLSSRKIPLKPILIDASNIRNNITANRYVLDIVENYLSKSQMADLLLSYRKMKDKFSEDKIIQSINQHFASKKGDISDKELSISLDTTVQSSWQTGIMPHLDAIPLPLVGKGEQNAIKVKLAMDVLEKACIFLIEEPENHLSYPNLNALIARITEKSKGKQLIITTHSSFVLNKLGVESVILFNRNGSATLRQLSRDTQDYFLKLPGHDTLRLILAKKVILVEGPSDELIVQRAFRAMYGRMPLEAGIDVISVGSLAFTRFLEIAKPLKIETRVITDNDGDIERLRSKYQDYNDDEKIKIYYDLDENFPTLEPQLVTANGLEVINKILGTHYSIERDLLRYMENHKTECALRIFNSETDIKFPEYINNAIRQ